MLAAFAAVMPFAAARGDAPARSSATCSDYANQRDAQRAADTRDADGDGIYCESLPCPCLKPGRSGGGGGNSGGRETETILARIQSVTDGDTIRVRAYRPRRRTYRVRLIGIDTPETGKGGRRAECGGEEASRAMRALAPRGRRVKLRTDPTQDRTDRFGRLLAYVYVGRRQLNVTQVSKGWSKTYVYRRKRFQQYRRFKRGELTARRRNRGIWGECGGRD
ncbi:MAG: thermonuclease family protein [Thermoleophilaceae bacterium]